MIKNLTFGDDARKKLVEGIDILGRAVAATLGPRGRNVVIHDNMFDLPESTKDGVTVAQAIWVEDRLANTGIQMLREAASQTGKAAGDGTTTSTVLAWKMLLRGFKELSKDDMKISPIQVKRDMDECMDKAVKMLRDMAIPVGEDFEKVKSIATISANNDAEIGTLLAKIIEEVGSDGVITVEEARGTQTYYNQVKGMQFDRGFLSPYFITNEGSRTVEYENPLYLLYDGNLESISEIGHILEMAHNEGRALIVIAHDVAQEPLSLLCINKIKNGVKVAAVKAPAFGERKKEILQDLAIITGGELISSEKGLFLVDVTGDHLGSSDKVIIDQDNTTIVTGHGSPTAIAERIESLKVMLEGTTDEYLHEKLQERIAKMGSGVAIIYVGAGTETEMMDKKYRIDDALHATRAAIDEGIVPGGGVALYNVAKALGNAIPIEVDSFGGKIVLFAMLEPLMHIVSNCGEDPESVLDTLDKMMEELLAPGEHKANTAIRLENTVGWDGVSLDYMDMIEGGIIDPVKVVRIALENAVSIAGMILTTEVVIGNAADADTQLTNRRKIKF